MIPIIKTDRLILRALTNEDFNRYAAFYAIEEQARYVGGQKNREQSWRSMALLLGHWSLMGHGYWAVVERASGEFAGCVGLWKSQGWPEMELGYWLAPEMQGKGYATEACLRAREYAFRTLGVSTLVSYISPENDASKRLALRLGANYDSTIELLDYGPHEVYRHSNDDKAL